MEIRTENLFMDNREDVAFLESEEGAKIIINLHVIDCLYADGQKILN